MIVERTDIPGLVVVVPAVWRDGRGSFAEVWQHARYADAGLSTEWAQDNVSRSSRGVLRGLHFQHPHGQGKLVTVLRGAVLDAVVDVRMGSPTFGEARAFDLTEENGRQLFVPAGFAHGFLVVSDEAIVHYKCTTVYRPEHERTLLWNDPALGIRWPDIGPNVSDKDKLGRRLADFPAEQLPRYGDAG